MMIFVYIYQNSGKLTAPFKRKKGQDRPILDTDTSWTEAGVFLQATFDFLRNSLYLLDREAKCILPDSAPGVGSQTCAT